MLVWAHRWGTDPGRGAEGSMSVTLPAPARDLTTECFSHEALFYRGARELVDSVAPFVREGVSIGEPVLVALLPDRIDALHDELGEDARWVTFLDMEDVGRNPARIIPAWREFVGASSGHAHVRGVGEPIWAGRRDAELAECQLHESLLNVAFDDGPAWRLLCPYDTESLSDSVVREAMRTHPVVWTGGNGRTVDYGGHAYASAAFAGPLSPSPDSADLIEFGANDLTGLRSVVERLGLSAGIGRDAVDDVTLAAHELATNSLVHGGGHGSMLVWRQPDAFVVEVRDAGRINDPLVGRELSSATNEHGRGLWMANQLCDLVQVRSTDFGTVVRLYVWG